MNEEEFRSNKLSSIAELDARTIPTGIGGLKFDNSKVRLDLLPDQALEQVAIVLTKGADKYHGPYNWAKGILYHRLHRAARNHMQAFWRGEDLDPEFRVHHIAHAICSLLFLLHYELNRKHYKKFDDRPINELKGNGE